MKNRFVIFFILILGLFVRSSAVFADPPDPFQINVVVTPPKAHIGDIVTARCVIMPLGNIYPLVQSSIGYPGLNVGPARFIRRAFDRNGPLVWSVSFIAERSGTITCNTRVFINGETSMIQDSATLEVVP